MADEVTQQILFKVAADTSAALSELQKLNEKNKEGSKSMVLSLADVKAGVDLVAGAYRTANEAIAEFAKDARNEAAAAGFQLEGLRKSTQNLINDDDLLALAAKNATGQFRLTQAQLESVGTAMIALRNKNQDLHQVQANFADFLSTGNTKALREYGINVKEASRTHEGFAEGLDKLIGLSKDAGLTTEQTGDKFLKSGIKLENSLDKLKDQFIQVAIHLAPIVSLVASLVDHIARGISLEEGIHKEGAEAKGAGGGIASALATRRADTKAAADQAAHLQSEALAREAFGGLEFAKKGFAAAFDAMPGRKGGGKGGALGGSVEFGPWGTARPPEQDSGFFMKGGGGPGVFGTERESRRVGSTELGFAQSGINFGGSAFDPQFSPVTAGEISQQRQADGAKMLERARAGMADLASETVMASETFGLFQSAAVEAFAAVATGTESLGGALQKLAGKFLMGEGTRLAGVAISEGVMALVHLANLDFVGAAAHGLAAGKAAAGSVALFALAGAMGVTGGKSAGGGASTGGASVAGLGGGAAVAGGGGAGSNVTIVLGNDFASASQNQRASRIRRALEDAQVPTRHDAAVFSG